MISVLFFEGTLCLSHAVNKTEMSFLLQMLKIALGMMNFHFVNYTVTTLTLACLEKGNGRDKTDQQADVSS